MKLNQLTIGFALLAALSACNSTDLGVSGTANPPATQTTQLPTPTVPGPPATTTPALPATPSTTVAPVQDVVAGAVKMRFAPIIGAPVDKVTPLSRRISARAKEQAITIVASTEPKAPSVDLIATERPQLQFVSVILLQKIVCRPIYTGNLL